VETGSLSVAGNQASNALKLNAGPLLLGSAKNRFAAVEEK
jgi:hypothetical protein